MDAAMLKYHVDLCEQAGFCPDDRNEEAADPADVDGPRGASRRDEAAER